MNQHRFGAVDRARLVLLVSLVVTLLLYLVPYGHILAYPLMLLSTLAHEMGHGVTAILVGGTFHRFQMWPDGSGVAVWGGVDLGRLDVALVAMGGLIGPAVAGAVGFAAGRTVRGARTALYVLAAILFVAELLVVRSLFGFFFVAIVLVGCLVVAVKSRGEVAQLVLIFLSVQLALSVFSRGDYLFVPAAQTAAGLMPSDTGQMAAALLLPYWFWGVVCGAVSVIVLVYGIRAYWR